MSREFALQGHIGKAHVKAGFNKAGELVLLVEFLIDRLRRCPMCGRWFVDETRNRSARRCSRKCTIAWSNAQRGT